MPPVVVFASAQGGHDARGAAPRLRAFDFTDDWAQMMSIVERVLTAM